MHLKCKENTYLVNRQVTFRGIPVRGKLWIRHKKLKFSYHSPPLLLQLWSFVLNSVETRWNKSVFLAFYPPVSVFVLMKYMLYGLLPIWEFFCYNINKLKYTPCDLLFCPQCGSISCLNLARCLSGVAWYTNLKTQLS